MSGTKSLISTNVYTHPPAHAGYARAHHQKRESTSAPLATPPCLQSRTSYRQEVPPAPTTCTPFIPHLRLNHPPLQHDPLRPIRPRPAQALDILRPALALRQLDVKVHDQMHEEQLDLVRREEPARTRLLPVPEVHRVHARRHELVPVLHARLLPQLLEPEPVEHLRFVPKLRVQRDLGRRGGDVGALGQPGAVGEGDFRPDLAVEGVGAEGVEALGLLEEGVQLLELWHAGLSEVALGLCLEDFLDLPP